MKNLIVIFGDQLSLNISSLTDCNKDTDIILMCEVAHEAIFVKHHKKKIAFLFSAMRHFALELESQGYKIHYVKLNDENNTHNFEGEVKRALQQFNCQKIILTEPSEYRVLENVKSWGKAFNIPVEILGRRTS